MAVAEAKAKGVAALSRTLARRPLRLLAGTAVALGVALLVLLLFRAIIVAAGGEKAGAPASVDIGHVLYVSTLQAGLSTVISLVIGTALAWALNRLWFFGRGVVIGLFASAIVTPGLIVAFGMLTIWGRSGWLNAVLAPFGLAVEVPIFGLGGIVAAHVILDGALAARLLLARLDALPEMRLKTGQSLGLSARQRFALIDWPAMRGTLPGIAAIIFLLAFTSFPIVLLLGGGPANETLEVAIYSAVRLDFDLDAAVKLALVQIAICGVLILVSTAFAPIPSSLGRARGHRWADRRAARGVQWLVVVLGVVGFGLPMLAVLGGLADGATFGVLRRPAFWAALASSFAVATTSAVLTLVLALALCMSRAATARRGVRLLLGLPAFTYLAVPAMVVALGFFLLVRGIGFEPERAGPAVVVIGNTLLSLPFAVATLGPPFEAIATGRGRLIRSLGLSGRQQFLSVEWPLIGRDVGVVLALAFCFSLGDLGIISLFGTGDFVTLPLLMVEALGAYRTNDAAAIAALLLVLTVAAFTLLPPLMERLSRADT